MMAEGFNIGIDHEFFKKISSYGRASNVRLEWVEDSNTTIKYRTKPFHTNPHFYQ